MIQNIISILSCLIIQLCFSAQQDPIINQTDKNGFKQGHWIKKNGNILVYDGFFKDNHPVGEFRRFFEDNTLQSLLIYSQDGKEADAALYHPNGFLASKGKYINQLKEGKWQFYSAVSNGYLICEEEYSKNLRNGLSVKFYQDKKVAEKMIYVNNIRQDEWTQYYQNGNICLKTKYLNGKIDGKFEVWFENGKIELSGEYKNDAREGHWIIYNEDGTKKYELDYVAGFTKNRQMNIDESNYIDSLEKNKGKIPDPEKTGNLW
jgi:antitoxin component YwqK of YwqJK toxin-antitoxin module